MDALLPPEMAEKAEAVGVKKANLPAAQTFVLAVLAGAFIALGGLFSTTVTTGTLTGTGPGGPWTAALPWGVTRLLGGTVFSLGLVLVIVGGAELFTGNTLLVMAWVNRKLRAAQVLRNWAIVYAGNTVGAVGTAAMVYVSGQWRFASGAVGLNVLATAQAKCALDPLQAVMLGVLCNTLVCLAVWLSFSARSTADRVLVIVPPIAAFVATGLEHSIANLYLVPLGWMIRTFAPPDWWTQVGRLPSDFPAITFPMFLLNNLLPVTLGNILGGAGLVGLIYAFVYLRR
jgi:formate transporter